jgi:thiol-disulfide isomerase/thioredoxin
MKDIRFKILLISLFILLNVSIFPQKADSTKPITVYVFLSETCPICQSYTLTLKELYKKYSEQNVNFIGVFPNSYSTQKEINEFKKKYSIPFELILDKDQTFTKHFNATITPEVFIEDVNKTLLYSGRIDDSFYALGKRRTVVTSTELADALSQISLKQTITVSKTQAVGCIISASK